MRSIESLATVAAAAFVFGAALAAEQKPEVAARWKASEITVDGVAREWEGVPSPLQEPKVSIGVVNDSDTLYVCLLASERQTREQILRMGLIVWFDPGGGTKKAFGIKFPVGLPPTGERRPGSRPSGDSVQGPPEPVEVVDRLEILGPGKDDRRSLILEQVPGIRAKVGQAEGVVTYELAVPLQRTADHPYAIGAKPGATVGIGLATPEQPRSLGPSPGGQPRSGFPGPGGMSGMGGMPSGMGGMPSGMGRGEFTPIKPMKTWLKVQLASPPA